MNNEQKTVQAFINSIVSKDYSQARTNLENAVAEKLKAKIRTHINKN
jgi:hypothetical protein